LGCKASLVFFQYFIMANFYWLLVEGLYLHTLLVVMFSENRPFVVYLLVGWGRTLGSDRRRHGGVRRSFVWEASCLFPVWCVQVFPPCSCSPGS
jgi:hypothetical protein